MTELAESFADITDSLGHVEAAEIIQDCGLDWRSAALRSGKLALAGVGISALVAAPAAARAVTAVEHMPPTQVHTSIAGGRVTAELEPGQDTIQLNILGQALVHPADIHVGRKHYGVTVNFDTASKAASLFTPQHTLDDKKVERVFAEFSDIAPQRKEIQTAIRNDVKHHALTAGSETLAAEFILLGLYGLQKHRRRNYTAEQRNLVSRDFGPIAVAGAVALSALGVTPIVQASRYYWAPNHHRDVVADPAFSGTSLAGWELDGFLTGLPDLGVQKLDETRQKNKVFYDGEVVNFKQALLATYGSLNVPKPPHTKRILLADDFQGIDGTTRVLGTAAKAYGVDAIAIGGDTEDSNLPFISVLDSLRANAKGIPVVLGTGAHDPDNISRLAKDHGFNIANGKIQEVAGIRFLPIADANNFGTLATYKSLLHKNLDETGVTQQAIDTVCTSHEPVIVVVHDHTVGDKIAETNCAADVLQGRSYFPPTPTDYGNTVAVTQLTSGGHTFGEGINLTGIIAGPAAFTIVDVNDKTLQFETMTTITMNPVPNIGGDTSTQSTAVTISTALTRSELSKEPGIAKATSRTLAANVK